jgi:hypothetical protein
MMKAIKEEGDEAPTLAFIPTTTTTTVTTITAIDISNMHFINGNTTNGSTTRNSSGSYSGDNESTTNGGTSHFSDAGSVIHQGHLYHSRNGRGASGAGAGAGENNSNYDSDRLDNESDTASVNSTRSRTAEFLVGVKESLQVRRSKIVVLTVLALAAAGAAVFLYHVTKTEETNDFQQQVRSTTTYSGTCVHI